MGQGTGHGPSPPDRRESPACGGEVPGGEGGAGIVNEGIDNAEARRA